LGIKELSVKETRKKRYDILKRRKDSEVLVDRVFIWKLFDDQYCRIFRYDSLVWIWFCKYFFLYQL